jgi:hypothetical protein
VPVIAVVGQDEWRRGKINHYRLTRLHSTFGIPHCTQAVIKITWRGMRFPPPGLRSGLGSNPALLQSRETPCFLGRAA